MDPLQSLGFALGTSFASGLNVYATVAAAGLFQRFGVIDLPPSLDILAHPLIIGIAATMFVVEFIADKIPLVDSAWDAVHTFIRPPAAMLIAWSAFGDVSEVWKLGAALIAGSVALTSHGAKASARAAANTSPEPFSNWILSFAEDAVAITLAWMAAEYPLLTAGIVVVLVVIATFVIWKLLGFFQRSIQRVRQAYRKAVADTAAEPGGG